MDDNLISLDSLGRQFGTDKCSWGHDYLRFYERYLAPFRNREVRLLEIGIAGGASLKVWENYFPRGWIVGADINTNVTAFARPRVIIEIVDQAKTDDLVKLGQTHGPFDIIVEDGSHFWAHQILALQTLFPFVVEGGIYIAEDLQTNFGAMAIGYRGNSSISFVQYVKNLVDIRVADAQIDVSNDLDPFIQNYARDIESINFYKECCLIEKRSRRVVDKPLVNVQKDWATGRIFFRAHIGGYGDRASLSSIVLGGREGQNIQGFAIESFSPLNESIAYRARLQDGSWTQWTRCGEYVGTRGKSMDLTGFAVRFEGESHNKFELLVIGAFRGLKDVVAVANGEECVAPGASGSLYGMQIAVRERALP